jgi:hypothetical protein
MSTNDPSLDPTAAVATICDLAARPVTLDGKVITLLDISKVKSAELLDRLEVLLRERARPKAILRRRKPTFASPAPDALLEQIVRESDAVIEALAH